MGGHNLPIVLKTNDTMGRYLAASRKIEARELIFQEDPIIMCPNAPPDSDSATCVGCCGISQNSVPCPKCGWPVCKEECGDVRTIYLIGVYECLCTIFIVFLLLLQHVDFSALHWLPVPAPPALENF